MPAAKTNYILLYNGVSQVYGSSSLETLLKSPPPKGSALEDRKVLFITYMPDEGNLCVAQLSEEELEEKSREIEEAAQAKAEKAAAKAAASEGIQEATETIEEDEYDDS